MANFNSKFNLCVNRNKILIRRNYFILFTFRNFKIRLRRDTLPFHSSVTMEIGNRSIDYDTSRTYTGNIPGINCVLPYNMAEAGAILKLNFDAIYETI